MRNYKRIFKKNVEGFQPISNYEIEPCTPIQSFKILTQPKATKF